MQWGNSDGIQGRCDAKCHAAISGPCQCMCGGRYHGAAHRAGGVDQAVREYSAEIEASARAKAKELGLKIEFADLPLEQMPLFRKLIGGSR